MTNDPDILAFARLQIGYDPMPYPAEASGYDRTTGNHQIPDSPASAAAPGPFAT